MSEVLEELSDMQVANQVPAHQILLKKESMTLRITLTEQAQSLNKISSSWDVLVKDFIFIWVDISFLFNLNLIVQNQIFKSYRMLMGKCYIYPILTSFVVTGKKCYCMWLEYSVQNAKKKKS